MVLRGMRGTFEERGLLDGMGDIGFEVPGFITDIAKAAAGAALTSTAQKLAPKPPAPPKAPPKTSAAGLSTGAKIAIGGGALLAVLLVVRGRQGRR